MSFDTIAVRSVLILFVGLAVALLLKKRAAATLHLVYAATLLSLVLLPVLRQWAPTHTVPLDSVPMPVRALATRFESVPLTTLSVPSVQPHGAPVNVGQVLVNSLIAIWVLGCLLLIVRLFAGVILTANLVRRSQRLHLFGSEAYEIRVTPGILVPATTWIGRAVILLPEAYESWPPERIRSVVLHEAAHIARHDWFVQFLGRVACASYWPNPLVWLANRRMVDAAEQAADDLVLEAGVTPSRYAEDLLQIARTVRRNQPALTIPMAMKNDVGRRIEMVLDNNKRRGSIHLGGLALAALGIAGVTIPAAALLLHRQGEVSTVQYADLLGGKTTPGSSDNGYVGTLADGRKVELLQIARLINGTVQAWRPNGTLIPAGGQLAWHERGPDKEGWLQFTYRIKKVGDVVHTGMDSAQAARSKDGLELFVDGWAPSGGVDGDGNILVVCDVGMRRRGYGTPNYFDPTAFVFYVVDGRPMIAASYDMASGRTSDNSDLPQRLVVHTNAELVTIGATPYGVIRKAPDGEDEVVHTPATTLSFDAAPNPISYIADAVGTTRSGSAVPANEQGAIRNLGGTRHVTDWFPRSLELAKIEIQLRDLHAVEMRGVHIRPNTVVTD